MIAGKLPSVAPAVLAMTSFFADSAVDGMYAAASPPGVQLVTAESALATPETPPGSTTNLNGCTDSALSIPDARLPLSANPEWEKVSVSVIRGGVSAEGTATKSGCVHDTGYALRKL